MEQIFLSYQDELTGRFVVIDELEGSIWAYLTFPNEERIDKDCFLVNRKVILSEGLDLNSYKKKEAPPLMIRAFSTSYSCLPNLKPEEISVEWKNGNAIIKINGKAFLFFALNETRGFSKSISKNGMYGNAWDSITFDEIFK